MHYSFKVKSTTWVSYNNFTISNVYHLYTKWFAWEFNTDITPSELETRIVILRKKDQDMVEEDHL
ncbi:hypothetical protein [Bacillus subtilis]|uniref:hypothetical protein n=1 Tax=Bacillus subtilis TaxID=1423 RepID=UPI0004062FED